jgi:hypothetical protein
MSAIVDRPELVVTVPVATVGEYRSMYVWLTTHSKRTRRAIVLLAVLTVGGLIAAIVANALPSGWNWLAQASFDIFVGGVAASAYFTTNTLVFAPRKAHRAARPYTYTFSSEGIAFDGADANGMLKWTGFTGFVSRLDSILFVLAGSAGALVFPRRMLTPPVSAEELEAFVGVHLTGITEY